MKKLKAIYPLIFLILLILFPTNSINGAKKGLLLWFNVVIPTLLPFILFSNLIIKSSSIKYFSYPFYFIYKKHPEYNPNIPFVVILGFLCGYPVGAKLINDLVLLKKFSKKSAENFLFICNNASPMFIIGYILTANLKNSINSILFCSFIYLPIIVFILIFFFNYKFNHKSKSSSYKVQVMEFNNNTSLDNCIIDAFEIIVKIGVYIMLFSILTELFLSINFLKNNIFILPFIELTSGIPAVLNSNLTFSNKIGVIVSATVFGGFSSIAQTKSVITPSNLSIIKYIFMKSILALISFLLVKLYFLYF